MKNKYLFLGVFIFVFIAFNNASFAYYGARPTAMGGAYTAVANDTYAAYYNPAGMALKPQVELAFSTLSTNRNTVMGDNIFASKFCYEAYMSSPFEWIMGVGFVSLLAMDTAKYLGDVGVLKKNWGRDDDTEVTKRDDPAAGKVAKKGENKNKTINPFKNKSKKPNKSSEDDYFNYGPINFNFTFSNRRHSYWEDRWDYDEEYTPANKAQFAAGFSWIYDDNAILNETRNWYTATVATGWEERVAVGANVNLYDLKTVVGSTDIKGFGAGLDLGVIVKPTPKLAFGLNAKEVLTTDIAWQNGAKTRYDMQLNVGAALDVSDKITVAADMHGIGKTASTVHYGAEFRPVTGLALRAGMNDNSKTAGIALGFDNIIVDYTYLGGVFNKTQMIGATIKL